MKFKKKCINALVNSIIYILFFISLYFYLLSLKGCYQSFGICAHHTKLREYFKLGFFLFLSCILFGVLTCIFIIFRLKIRKYFFFLFIFFLIFYSNQGTDFANHGTYNSIIFILFLPFLTIFIYVIYVTICYLYNLYIKKFLISILFFIYIFFSIRALTNCRKFYDGIGRIKLINDKKLNSCYIKKPFICGFDLLSGLFDVNYFRKNGCMGYNSDKKEFLKYLNKNMSKYNFFAYPRTNQWNPKFSYYNLANLIEKNIFPVTKNNYRDKEVFLKFKNDKGTIKINLKKNKTLIKEKRKLVIQNPVQFENIYLIYLDAMSRLNFIRSLKKTTKIIEKIIYGKKRREEKDLKYNAFQFFKYHNFNLYTEGNIFPIFYGNKRLLHKGISLVKFLNEKGFITASAHNSCNRDIFDWHDLNKDIELSNYDHENVAMFCDTNFEDKKNKWSITKGKSSIFRKCLYNRDSFDYNFEYILQFLKEYKEERKYFRIGFGDGHESTTEVIKYIDESLSNFIEKLLDNYFTNKTAIIIMSDHGAHIPGPHDILFYEEKKMEKYLGLLLFILPNDGNYKLKNIIFNQQQMITPYDIYDTLLDLINVDKNVYKNLDKNKGQSLFKKINGKERNCENYTGEITDDVCFCQKYI